MVQYRIYDPKTKWASKPINKQTADYINANKSMFLPAEWVTIETYNGK